MKKNSWKIRPAMIVVLAMILIVAIAVISCKKAEDDEKKDDGKKDVDISQVDTSDRDEKGFSKNMHDALFEKYGEPAQDIYEEGTGVIGWWDDYARFSVGDSSTLKKTNADADTTGSRNDEGRGAYARQVDSLTGIATMKTLHKNGFKAGAWIECQGDSRTFMMLIHQNSDGSFEIDPRTGAAKLYAWVWGWSTTSKNKNANYKVWCGVHSFVNNEEWAYPYVLSEYPEMSTPTYPDGTPAVGYLDGGDYTTPHLAKFYDACAAKDLNGSVIRFEELFLSSGVKEDALVIETKGGLKYRTDDFSFGKDASAPFWLEYSRNSIEFWIKEGVDYFWIDNWCGWDNFNNTPLKRAFGDWSEYKFKQYLKQYPELGVADPDNFSISEYVKKKAKEINDLCSMSDWSDPTWKSPEWNKDPIWMAYLAFKAKENRAYNSGVNAAIKEFSLKYNGDAEAVGGLVNDFPYMTFAAFDCDALDMISTEYNTNFSAATQSYTSGVLPNRYSGHAYSLLSNSSKAHTANIWYYASQYPYTDTSGQVYGYEALAYNVTTHNAFGGTTKSNTLVNTAIGTLKEYFSDRRLYSNIGIMYSPDSETCELAPGGYNGERVSTHDLSYMGWAQSFDELNVPYKSIQFQRIEKQIGDCSVLILPNVLAIDQATIDNIFKPWLDKGNTLIITGAEAGKVDRMENNYTQHEKPILVEFANSYDSENGGKVIYLAEDPCYDYFGEIRKKSYGELYEAYLKKFEGQLKEWIEKGYIEKIFEVDLDVSKSVITTLNYSATAKRFFIDIANLQYDHEADVLTEMPDDLTVKVQIPSNYWGYDDLKVSIFTDDTGEVKQLTKDTDYTIDEITMTITVPKFAYYATIMVEAA